MQLLFSFHTPVCAEHSFLCLPPDTRRDAISRLELASIFVRLGIIISLVSNLNQITYTAYLRATSQHAKLRKSVVMNEL